MGVVIQSFADNTTRKVWIRERVARIGLDVQRSAHRKLRQLNAADRLDDLRVPPGNRLEKLRGDRAGQYSIRVNDQFRICFTWTAAGPVAVELVDYH
ncbi:type II toxin-antitoxin system RelE/ParE family toxin [Actinopolymorpha sp. B11F2]|uniref:type II toxin-antitoxin system RelE/ParE family toxin n=1 Tax=Actinopolymorpha sp. B11F2 TaxID=3160862 RepID=UPI0032E4DAD7